MGSPKAHSQSNAKLASSFRVDVDRSRIPPKILSVIDRGQGKQPCCVAFTHMNSHVYRGTWGGGSVRFLHCMCKMLDGGLASGLGTTMLTGVRAEKGWWTCEEDLWPSNVDLSVDEFADWRSIPREAWEDAKKKRIRSNKARVVARRSSTVNIRGQTFRLLSNYFEGRILREDRQFDIMVIDKEFDTVAWAQLRAYVKLGKIVLEDLFVKPEARRVGIGSELIRRIEHFSCLDAGFLGVSGEITVPIPRVDIWLPCRHQAAKTFFVNNGYVWQDTQSISGPEYSLFTARKKLPCAQISKKVRFANEVIQGSKRLILPLNYLRDRTFVRRRREPIEGPCFVHVHLLSYGLVDAWQCIC